MYRVLQVLVQGAPEWSRHVYVEYSVYLYPVVKKNPYIGMHHIKDYTSKNVMAPILIYVKYNWNYNSLYVYRLCWKF